MAGEVVGVKEKVGSRRASVSLVVSQSGLAWGRSEAGMAHETDPIQRALALPSGARFYRCALQVNPFEYLKRHNKPLPAADEESYNRAIIRACLDNEIEVIGVTDHHRIDTSRRLVEAAQKRGLVVFPGFEAATKDGVHFLCLFEPGTGDNDIERALGDHGIHGTGQDSSIGDHDADELLERCQKKWRGACIAAHVAAERGLLRALKGQSRARVWKSSYLMAAALPGPIDGAPEDLRSILRNKDPEYLRERPVAVINANDVNCPEDLSRPEYSCLIKMSEVTIEGLRQAFLDPDSRIRLLSDPVPDLHMELEAIAWEGGFLDEQALHFNENLNVLIGGRGVGKSTLIESIRYVLDLEPLGPDARKSYEGILRDVLRNGTRVSLRVRSFRPSKQVFLVERIVPNPPTVRDEQGQVLPLRPRDILPRVELYGQHEISELAKSPEKQTHLLDRFLDGDPDIENRKSETRRALERSRSQWLTVREELRQIEDHLSRLPALEETLRHYQEAGLEERLKEQSLVVREERLLASAEGRVAPFQELLDQLRRSLPIDRAFLSAPALADLPGREILGGADDALTQLDKALQVVISQLGEAVERVLRDLATVRERWEDRKEAVRQTYEKILRELQKSSVDGEGFLRLRRQIEDLRPRQERLRLLRRDLEEIERHRRNLMAEWEETKSSEFRRIERAAKKVSRKLAGRVRVQVTSEGDREPLLALLGQIGGRLSETYEAIRNHPALSLRALSDALRSGSQAAQQLLGIPPSQAERLASAPLPLILQIEELDLQPTAKIELNIAAEGQSETWQHLESLSTGQKATAILLLLLLESDAPLIVDQPEDDLDNRFITEVVVPKMREEKRRRQFIFSSHNANIPVLGDAELIVGLRAAGEAATRGQAEIPREHLGSIDARPVRELVEEILEGGEKAFELRRLKYGF